MKVSIAFFVRSVIVLGFVGMSVSPAPAATTESVRSDFTLRITTCLPDERPVANAEVRFTLTGAGGRVYQDVRRTDARGIVAFDGSAARCCDIVDIRIGTVTGATVHPFTFMRACGECKGRVGPWDIKNWTVSDCQDPNCCPEWDKTIGAWHLRLDSRP